MFRDRCELSGSVLKQLDDKGLIQREGGREEHAVSPRRDILKTLRPRFVLPFEITYRVVVPHGLIKARCAKIPRRGSRRRRGADAAARFRTRFCCAKSHSPKECMRRGNALSP